LRLVVVLIPAHNEEATLGELLARVGRVRVPGCRLLPLVVDDGSEDETARVAREGGALVVRHPRNRGLGAAVRTGLRAAVRAGADAVAYLDADLEYFPEDIPTLLGPVLSGRADYVLGSRFRSGGALRMRPHRLAGNLLFTGLLALLARRTITDGQTGMRAFSREAASRAEIIHDYNYAQVLTLDLLRKGFRMEEVPIRYRPRRHGESFIGWRYPLRVLPAIWRELRSP
jgi:glycosyltransferase involved in cell wall biosynthesis